MALQSSSQPLGLASSVRLGFGGISLVFAVVTNTFTATLPWILLVVCLDLVTTALSGLTTLPARGVLRSRMALLALNAGFTGAAFVFAGGATAPLALIPAYHSGLLGGRRGFAISYVVAAASAVAAFLFLPSLGQIAMPTLIAWLLSIAMLGTLGAWSHSASAPQVDDPAAREAVVLLARLRELSDDLGTGLDAPAHAAAVLDDLSACAPSDRSFLLVGSDPVRSVPVALRGATRLPWSGDGQGADVLERAWQAPGPTTFATEGAEGLRHVLSVPLFAVEGSRNGVLIADRRAAFSDVELAAATDMFATHQTRLNAAMLFADLRTRAGIEERRRLAREMHDGIAQELAALGYVIDALRMQAASTQNPLAADLNSLRESLKTTLADVRGHIADLKMPQRTETGLGATLGAAVQNFGAVTGLRTTVTMRESGLRLPGHVELLVYRATMDTLVDAQAGDATQVMLDLESHGPDLQVTVRHDGTASPTRTSTTSQWKDAGGQITIDQRGTIRTVTFTWAPPAGSGQSASGASGVMAS